MMHGRPLQSFFAPDISITIFQFTISLLMKAANSSGVVSAQLGLRAMQLAHAGK